MAGPNYVIDKGFKSGGAITKYSVVELGASEIVTAANAATDPLIGVAQEEVSAADATSGRIVNVRMFGISRVLAGSVLATPGVEVTTNATGQVVAAAAGNSTIGILLQAATTTGQHVDVLVSPANPA